MSGLDSRLFVSPPTSESFYSPGVLRKLTNHTTKKEKQRDGERRKEGEEENSGNLAWSLTKTKGKFPSGEANWAFWHLLLCFRHNNQYKHGSSLIYWFIQIHMNKCPSVWLAEVETREGVWQTTRKRDKALSWLHMRCTASVWSSPEVTTTIRSII